MPSQTTPAVIRWYRNKTYQCPQCHHDTVPDPSIWEVYTCCNCSTRFSRFPRLRRILRHVGVSCEECTRRHPVCVDGEPFGFLRRRHSGIGTYARHRFEAWLYAPDEFPLHRDGVHYVNTRASRDEAMADLAHWRSFLGRADDDLSPVIGVVADEEFSKYVPNVTEDEEQGFRDGALEVYGVGMLRPYPAGHRRRGQFYADAGTFTWGLIAPYGLEGIYTKALPASLAQYTPRL